VGSVCSTPCGITEVGKRQKAKGKRQKAKGKRHKAKGKRQKVKGKSRKWVLNALRLHTGGQKAKVGSVCSSPFGFTAVGIFCLLPFAFCLSGCCFSPQSKIQNRESKIMCRPFGNPDWVTETAKRLGLEWTIRPRGRPKKQSQGLPQLPVFFRFGGCHLSPRAKELGMSPLLFHPLDRSTYQKN